MSSLLVPILPLVDPVDGTTAAVEGRRWIAPLLAVMACVSLAAVALFLRWDAGPQVVAELTASGELSRMTEQELSERVTTTERVGLVTGVARGLLFPLFALALAVALKFTGWLIGRRVALDKCLTIVAVALLPVGLYHLIYAAVAFHQLAVTDAQRDLLVPSSFRALFPGTSPKLARVLGALDFFKLWSAGLLGLGFAAASGMRTGRSVLLGYVLYALFAAAFMVGLPGLLGGKR